MFRIVVHSYPNNEIRSVFCSMPPLRSIDYSLDDDSASVPISIAENPPHLSLGSNSKPCRKMTGYGDLPTKPTQFGLNAKRSLIRSGAALEKKINSPEECLFLTGTLPGSTPESFSAIAAYSAYVVNNLKAWIAKRVSSKLDFYCWEYQKRGALHLHYCVWVPDIAAREHVLSGFRDWWISTLIRISEVSGVDLFRKNAKFTHRSDLSKVRAVAEICRKSPARYMAKYLSKSSSKLKGRAIFFTPSRWWGVSRPLKAVLDSLSTCLEIISGSYFSCVRKMQEINHSIESTEGALYTYPHKFGMGETKLIYPSDESDFNALLQDLESMAVITKMNARIADSGMTAYVKPYKIRLIRWASEYSVSLEKSHQGLSHALIDFMNAIYPLSPASSDDALSVMQVMSSLTYNIREVANRTPAMWNRNHIELFELALFDFEEVIKILSYNSNTWID